MGIKTIEDKVIASWFSVSVLQDLHSFVAVDVSLKYFVCLCLFNSRFFIHFALYKLFFCELV